MSKSALAKLYWALSDLFGDRLKASNPQFPITSDWFVGKYVIVPNFGSCGFEEFVVYDTAIHEWETIRDEPDDGSKELIRCRTPEALFLALS